MVRKQRKQLVLLDDLILDVSSYKFDHPGGMFLLQSLIGKDISKYFHGGYTYENYIADKTTHTHSPLAYNYALKRLAIGRLRKTGGR